MIEFPYYDEDEDPFIEFQIMVVFSNSEKNLKAKLRFEECQLNYDNRR